MSEGKQIRKNGIHQEDHVEMLYYLVAGFASIRSYLSTVGYTLSALIGSLSAEAGSGSATKLSVSGIVSVPTSLTSMTGVSISLL